MAYHVIIFGADINSFVHIDSKYKDVLFLGEGSTRGIDDIKSKAEAK